jgi:hypothetical protein
MVAVPGDAPVIFPPASTLTIAVLLLLHAPPLMASLRAVVAPWHTCVVPVIADGVGLMVTVVLMEQPARV